MTIRMCQDFSMNCFKRKQFTQKKRDTENHAPLMLSSFLPRQKYQEFASGIFYADFMSKSLRIYAKVYFLEYK